jgi:hypothetical protein
MVAQFAGVVPFREAFPSAPAGHTHEHAVHLDDTHTHKHASSGAAHHHHDGGANAPGDQCCALHSFFAAIVPVVLTPTFAGVLGPPLEARQPENMAGIGPGRIDRPPRTLLLI